VELHGGGLDRGLRERTFTRVVLGCVQALGPAAILWKPTRRLVRPDRFVAAARLLGELSAR
jgi:hypothetical protein